MKQRTRRHPWAVVIFGLSAFCFMGCAGEQRDQQINTVLEADPQFDAVLEQQQRIINQISTYHNDWELKKTKIEKTIETLRKDLKLARADVERKSDEVRKQLAPIRSEWDRALIQADEELRMKQVQRGLLSRSIAKLRKVVRLAGEAWPKDERQRQEEQLEAMLQDMERIETEVTLLKEHIHLLKLKLEITEISS